MPSRLFSNAPVAAMALATDARAVGIPPPVPFQRAWDRMVEDVKAKRERTAMSHQIKSLGDVLRGAPERLARAHAAGQKLSDSLDDLDNSLGKVEDMTAQVKKHVAAVDAALGGLTNGGPQLDDEQKAG